MLPFAGILALLAFNGVRKYIMQGDPSLDESLIRLFSTFARGRPGAGLPLRLVAGAGLVIDAVRTLLPDPPFGSAIRDVLAAGTGILLSIGLWTPIAAGLVAIFELWPPWSDHARAVAGTFGSSSTKPSLSVG